jgi:hypothetical protein
VPAVHPSSDRGLLAPVSWLLGLERYGVVVDPGSKNRLMPEHVTLFPGETLFDRIARAVCTAGLLPRKELYEAWEVARRARRRFHGGRVVDWACGHGLLAQIMLILDDTSESAIAYDVKPPPSAQIIHEALRGVWPRLRDQFSITEFEPSLTASDVLVSCHACGSITDDVIAHAIEARCCVAVLPCCHDFDNNDAGGLQGWMDQSLAIDATRAATLRAARYRVWTQTIPEDITPKNRLLLGAP